MTTVHAQTGIKLATKPAKTSLLGGHFIYKADGTTETPPSANVVESVNNNPALWGHNVHIGSNGIKLRYGETTLSKWGTDSLIFYTPTTTNGITTTAKAIELNSTNGIVLYKDGTNKGLQLSSSGLEIFGSSQSTADVIVNNSGIEIVKGGIKGGTPESTTNRFVYLSTEDYGTGLVINSSAEKTDWRLVVGGQFGVDHYGRMWALGAHINGEIRSTTGTIGGWTLSINKLYNGNIGDNNSASLATSNLPGTVAGKTFSTSDIATTGWRLTVGSNFGVDNTGKLYASSAEISGKISAESGYIGTATDGFIIDSYGFYVGTKTSNTTNSIALSRQLFTRTIDGTSRSDLCFAIGSKFAVDKDGNLYANGANITDITASSLNIGPVIYYGVCSTAQSTQIKEVTIDSFQLVKGATVVITFVNGNSNSAPSLKINDGNAIAIKAYDGTSLSSYEYSFTQSNVSRTFTYNGTYWLLQDSGAGDARSSASSAAYTAYNYITYIDSAGIFISPSNQSPTTSSPGNSVKINGEGMEIYNNGISVAKYGSDVRIGKPTSSNVGNVYIDDDSIDIRKGSTILSTFTANGANLGVNSAFTTIQLCGGVGQITAASVTQMQQGMLIRTNPDSDKGSYMQFDALAKDGSTSVFSSTVQLRNDKVSGTNQYKAYIKGDLDNYNTDDSLFFTVSPLGVDMDFEDASKNQAQLRISTPETSLFLGIGSGGSNHGIYSNTLSSWIIYASEGGYAFTQLSFAPHTNATSTSNGLYLGWSTHRWRVVYAANGTVQTSDRKHKNIIGGIDFAKDLIMGLEPVEYQWKDSDHRRTHMGFIAQDSAEVAKFLNKDLSFYEAQYLDGSDYRGEETDDENLMWSMKYDELIAPLIKVVQEQQAEIDELKQRIEALERR